MCTTSHIPSGGFTALCKAFRLFILLHGLTVETPAIRHCAKGQDVEQNPLINFTSAKLI
jgi:hypothetical protein